MFVDVVDTLFHVVENLIDVWLDVFEVFNEMPDPRVDALFCMLFDARLDAVFDVFCDAFF